MNAPFADHFSAVAAQYANARPAYPPTLFDWIASLVSPRALCWEPGCGSGQASRDLARLFDRVHATDPSAAQVAQARGPANVAFSIEPGERCALPDASVDAVCVAQALHWFDRPRFFAECARVLRPGGVLVAWGYQDLVAPEGVDAAIDPFRAAIEADWPLARMLAYFSSYSATQRHREAHGADPVARHAPAIAAAWGDPDTVRTLRWPLFAHARRKEG